jgi:hypothetical protein
VLHTAHASSRRIQLRRLLLLFKCDAANRLHLLFCASMRYEPVRAPQTLVHVASNGAPCGSTTVVPPSPFTPERGSTSARKPILRRASSSFKRRAEGANEYSLREVVRIQAAWRGRQARRLAFRIRVGDLSTRILSVWRALQARRRVASLGGSSGFEEGGQQPLPIRRAGQDEAEEACGQAESSVGVATASGDEADASSTEDCRLRAVGAVKGEGGPERPPAGECARDWANTAGVDAGGSTSAASSRLSEPARLAVKVDLRPPSVSIAHPSAGELAGEDGILARPRVSRRATLMGPLNLSPKFRPPSACAGDAWATDLFQCPSCGVGSRILPTSIPCAIILACRRRVGRSSRAPPEDTVSFSWGCAAHAGAQEARGESRHATGAETDAEAADVREPLLLPQALREAIIRTQGSADGGHNTSPAHLSKQEVQVCEDCYLAYTDAALLHSHARPRPASPSAGSPTRPLPVESRGRRPSGASCISLLPRSASASQLGWSAHPMSAPSPIFAAGGVHQPRPLTAGIRPVGADELFSIPPMAHVGLRGIGSGSHNSSASALGSADGLERPATLCAAKRFNTRLTSALALDAHADGTTRSDFYQYGGVGVILAPPPSTAAARPVRPHTAFGSPEAPVLSKVYQTAPRHRQPLQVSKSAACLREQHAKRDSGPRISKLARAWLESPYQST